MTEQKETAIKQNTVRLYQEEVAIQQKETGIKQDDTRGKQKLQESTKTGGGEGGVDVHEEGK